jgi:hypothetical protein
MSGLVGNPRTLKRLTASLRDLPTRVASRIAERSAPLVTGSLQSSFNAGTDPYGQPWAPGADGKPVDLVETGKLRSTLSFYPIGRRIIAKLGTRYAKYQVGRRKVFPPGGRPLPVAWSAALAETANAEIRAFVEGRFGG